tara:strand:+ start:424 stop:1857 length:1434 start_codon:yes stop_codon:yes gene_type:complete
MAIIGGQINPAFYQQPDYNGVVASAQNQSQGIANIGKQIGGAIKQYGDDEKTIKKSAQMAKSIRDAIPELAGMANNALAELSNPDLSQRDRLAIAEGIQDSLKIGVIGLENNRSNATLGMQKDELAAKIAAAKNAPLPAPDIKEIPVDGGTQMMEWNGRTGRYEPIRANVDGGIAPPDNVLPMGNPMDNTSALGNSSLTPNELKSFNNNLNNSNQDAQMIADAGGMVLPNKPSNQSRPGFKPNNQGETFRPANTDEIARYGVNGQVDLNGRFYPVQPPSGMSIKTNPDGSFEFVQGAGKGGKTPQEIVKSKADFSDSIGLIANAYSQIYTEGSAVVGGKASLANVLSATDAGQVFGRITGDKAQVYRDVINTQKPNVINAIREITGMSAKQMDSEKELQMYLKAMGDPILPVEANMQALLSLDKKYADGTITKQVLDANPNLAQSVSGYDIKLKDQPKDSKLKLDDETEQMLKDLGL